MWSRLEPAFSLVLLAPLIAEYLLGSLSFRQLALFPIMALMYGAGALFVRETARRSGRGWPAILLLGLAYGVIEEGLATQSLFNPHYLGLRLLDYGFIPALGIGAPWTVYVVILHVAWSVAVPVALVETLFPDRRETAWLGRTGYLVSGAVYALGVALVTFGTRQKEHFSASSTQLAVTAVVAGLAVAAAFVAVRPRTRERTAGPVAAGAAPARGPLRFGVLAFVLGSIFHLVTQLGQVWLPPTAAAAIALLLPLALLEIVRREGRRGSWTAAETDALMLGGLLAYCWLGFFLAARLHGVGAVPGQVFPCVIVLGLVYARFIRRRDVMRE